jgi:hypothetical protein
VSQARELFTREDPTIVSEADLKRVYFKLAKKYHPDV